MFVLVVGGGKVGYYLTRELIESGHEVVLMERDAARASQIADEVGSIVTMPRPIGMRTRPRSSCPGASDTTHGETRTAAGCCHSIDT